MAQTQQGENRNPKGDKTQVEKISSFYSTATKHINNGVDSALERQKLDCHHGNNDYCIQNKSARLDCA